MNRTPSPTETRSEESGPIALYTVTLLITRLREADMSVEAIKAEFLRCIPTEYPHHMLCFFANNMAHGRDLPFTTALFEALNKVESVVPGYANEMISRIAAINNTGEDQYETILSILAEIYVTAGLCERVDEEEGVPQFTHEPAIGQQKNPEFEVRVSDQWCAIEVKTLTRPGSPTCYRIR